MGTVREQTSILTVQLPPAMNVQLHELARATGRESTDLAIEAIRTYLEIEAAQVAGIQEAIRRADAGEFAPEEHVAAVRERFCTTAPPSRDWVVQ